MATGAKLGIGTLLRRETTPGSGVYETIIEVRKINTPKLERPKVPVTHMESPDATEETIPGLGTLPSMACETNWRPDHATQNASTGIVSDWHNRITRGYKVVYDQFSGDPTMVLSAYVASYGEIQATPEGALFMPFELQLVSIHTWA
jgi:hypothetical protein